MRQREKENTVNSKKEEIIFSQETHEIARVNFLHSLKPSRCCNFNRILFFRLFGTI